MSFKFPRGKWVNIVIATSVITIVDPLQNANLTLMDLVSTQHCPLSAKMKGVSYNVYMSVSR